MTVIDYESVFSALPSPYMLLDRDLRYVAVNPAYEAAVMRSRDELLGQRLFDLFPNEGQAGERLRRSFERVLATGEADTIAYIPYDIPRPAELGGGMEVRYWTAVHTPIAGPDGATAFIMQNTVDVTELTRLREAATLPFNPAATSLLERTREMEAASADFRRLFQQAPAFFAVLSGPEHIFTFTSDSYRRLIGGRDVVGRPLRQALPEVVEQGFVELLDSVYRDGQTHAAEGARVVLENAPGQPAEEHFLDFSYDPIRAADGSITGVFVQGMDRTESFRAQARQRLLIDELNHRVKNTLATVQSIAALTLRSAPDVDAARAAFQARIAALSKAHNVLSERKWNDTELGSIVRQELGAYDSTHVRIGGPDLVINAKTTVALALLFHELATNAAKHGALSTAEGTLSVAWHESDEDELVVEWAERGGPAVSPPSRQGFGTRMLNAVVTGELGGALDVRYPPEGFSASLRIPAEAYRRRPVNVG